MRCQISASTREQSENNGRRQLGRVASDALLNERLFRFLLLKEPFRGAVTLFFVAHGDEMRRRRYSTVYPPVALLLGQFEEATGRGIRVSGGGSSAYDGNRKEDFSCRQKAGCAMPKTTVFGTMG